MLKKILALAVVFTGTAFGADAATRSILYVANSQGDDITIIDLATQKVIKTLKVGPIVHGVCAPGRWTAGLRHHRIRTSPQGHRHQDQHGHRHHRAGRPAQ